MKKIKKGERSMKDKRSATVQKNYTPKDQILSTLIAAKGKGVKREYLSKRAKVTDRQLRHYIAELRDEGYLIGQACNGGYSFNNLTDIKRLIIKEKARAKSINKRIKNIERAIEHQPQLMMEL